jgi:hypothetical protein
MHLICLLEHLHGQDVLVDGTTYTVGADGRAHVPDPAHAKALLANASGWMLPPEPLMPLGEDGLPEHLMVPKERPRTPEVAPDITAAVANVYTDPGIVAHIPATETVGEPISGIDFQGHVVTESDDIRAKAEAEAFKPTQVSAPSTPISATIAKTNPRKGKHK